MDGEKEWGHSGSSGFRREFQGPWKRAGRGWFPHSPCDNDSGCTVHASELSLTVYSPPPPLLGATRVPTAARRKGKCQDVRSLAQSTKRSEQG